MAYYQNLPVYRKTFELILYIEIIVRNFPRYHKYAIGAEMRSLSKKIAVLIIKANSQRDKVGPLTELRDKCEEMKLLITIGKEIKAFRDFGQFLSSFNLKRRNIKMIKVFVICIAFLYMVLPGVSAAGSLTDNGNGTVTDSGTHLMWQQEENSTMTWEAALSYCEGLTLAAQTDWRLPNIKELSSIVDDTRYSPAINTTYFPSTISSYYWSSTTNVNTTNANTPSYAWDVNFNVGDTSHNIKTDSYYVRCVRGGQ